MTAMKTYTFDDPALGRITYRDNKRYLWLSAVFFPLIPFVGMGLMAWSGQEWTLWAPLIAVYALVPLLDFVFQKDASNPPEQIVPQLEADPYYRLLIYVAVPLHFVVLVGSAWFVATHDLGWFGLLGLSLLVGAIGGFSLNLGHELGHKGPKIDRLMARLALAVPFYGHFSTEHNAGHHAEVATPEDSASSRFGESIYRFALREIPGALKRAWRLESKRLRRCGHSRWGRHNEILQSYIISVLLYGGLLVVFGLEILPFLLIQTANANHLASNLVLFHLERHSDHHTYANRRYQSLRHYDDVPQLPSGYFGMFVLAYVPTLWYRIMNPRVLSLVDGDLSRVNVDPAWQKKQDVRQLQGFGMRL
jgi:alkane 1-monooxygenase